MYATPKELIEAFRNMTRDTVEPYLWSDAELYQYATQGEATVAQRTDCITDSSSVAAVLDISAGEAEVDMHPSIVRVKAAYLLSSTQQKALELRTIDGVRESDLFIRTGEPARLIFGATAGKMRLYPIPVEDGVLQLVLIRLPLKTLTDSSTKFEVPFAYTTAILEWMRYRAYAKLDSDTYDPGQSEKGYAAFGEQISNILRMESMKVGGLKDGVVTYGGL